MRHGNGRNRGITNRPRPLLPAPDWMRQRAYAALRARGIEWPDVPMVVALLDARSLYAVALRLGYTLEPTLDAWVLSEPDVGALAECRLDGLESRHTHLNAMFGLVRMIGPQGDELWLYGDTSVLWVREQPLVGVLARDAGRAIAFIDEIIAAYNAMPERRIRVYGSQLRGLDVRPVLEDEIIWPGDEKRALLDELDAFWRRADWSRRHGFPAHRGVLLAGPPGCGKTMFIRHLVARWSDVSFFFYLPESAGSSDPGFSFRDMVGQVLRRAQPAVIVVEDLDKLFRTGVVTPQFFLNVVDGVLELPLPVLWIATFNDAELDDLQQNILNRPGRFDRLFLVGRPGRKEVAELIVRYTPSDVCGAEDAARIGEAVAGAARGLSAVHVREACWLASIRRIENGADYATALRESIAALKAQAERAEDYRFERERKAIGIR